MVRPNVMEQLRENCKGKLLGGTAACIFTVRDMLSDLTLETCSRQRADAPANWQVNNFLHGLVTERDTMFVGSTNISVEPGHEFDPAPTRTLLLGQSLLTFVTLTAAELLRLLGPFVKPGTPEEARLQELKNMLVKADGRKCISFTNESVARFMDKLIDAALLAAETKNYDWDKLFNFDGMKAEGDEGAVMECYAVINAFFRRNPDSDFVISAMDCLLHNVVVSCTQFGDTELAKNVLDGFAQRNEPN